MSQLLIESMAARTGLDVRPSFARSETFHPRYGWLKKGFDAVTDMPDIFLRPDATTLLGVGKNMVRAIRYWCLAYKVIEESPNAERPRLKDAAPSAFGEQLLGPGGWDPYLEDPGSLWLLHWQLLRPPCLAPAWFAIFNGVQSIELTDESLLAALRVFADAHPEWGEIADNSLRKDARCLLRMYAQVTAGRDLLEDSVDSPFAELDLIKPVPGSRRHYVFNRAPKLTLPPSLLVYACLDFADFDGQVAAATTLGRLTRAPGSPGLAFRVTEDVIADAIEHVAAHSSGIRLTHAAGVRQLLVADALPEAKRRIIEGYFRQAPTRQRRAA